MKIQAPLTKYIDASFRHCCHKHHCYPLKKTTVTIVLGILLLVAGKAQTGNQVNNDSYSILFTNNNIQVSRLGNKGVTRNLAPQVQLLWMEENPHLKYLKSTNQLSPQAGWTLASGQSTTDVYKAAHAKSLKAQGFKKINDRHYRYLFRPIKQAALTLDIRLPNGQEAPVFEVHINALTSGWFSAAFAGIAPRDTSELEFIYQPMIWSWRRFPDQSYITPEQYATTAACFVNDGEATEGIAPDAIEIPYRFANLQNSRFGLLLRNAGGKAQPMVFSPLLGGGESYLEPRQHHSFKTRYIINEGDWYSGVQYLLNNIFHYHNERKNASVTLNQTIDNIISLAMDDIYGGWNDTLKGFTYDQDAVGTVKVVSAMHQLSIALVTGNEEIYRRRAIPTIEYIMSREKYLFTTNELQKSQSPGYTLNGPCAEIGELSGLYQLTNGNTKAFAAELDRVFGKARKLNLNTETGGGSWQDYLYRYRISTKASDLKKAVDGANAYLEKWIPLPSRFDNDPGLKDKDAAFLTDFTPRLYDLLELYEETGHRPYLDWAITAARQMILWTRSNPLAPDSTITVNEGGQIKGFIGKRYKLNSYEFLPGFNDTTKIQEQQVPAWQTSLVGLPPEQPGTYVHGPIMLNHHPAWFLRLAQLSGDSLLRDVAYNAILGRYAGFPGYYYTSLHTNVYQKADYAMHPFINIKYNAIFHNHIFPHITLLIDFLVSDAQYRSEGKVYFPGVYAPGYAYLSSKVYGSKTGNVFGNKNVRLWLPAAAIQSNSSALNHVLGIGEKDFYVILMNTLSSSTRQTIRLNPDIIPWVPGKTYSVITYNRDGSTDKTTCKDGILEVTIPQHGLTAYKIEGLRVTAPHAAHPDLNIQASTGKRSFQRDDQSAFGTVTGMLINTFPEFSDAYIFTNATSKEFQDIVLEYRIDDGSWQKKTDNSYPFEFDIRLNNPAARLEYRLHGSDYRGKSNTGKTYELSNNNP